MSMPPRMLLLVLQGEEHFVSLPVSYEKAVQLATEKFLIAPTHVVRLSCPSHQLPNFVSGFAVNRDIYIMDNDSYHYACANKQVVRLDVHVLEKVPSKPAAPAGGAKEEAKPAPPPEPQIKTATQAVTVETTAGKSISLTSSVTGELAKGAPAGQYLGTLTVEKDTFGQRFIGKQLGPNEVLTKFVVHEKNTARLLFRPRSVRPQIDVLYPEESSLEVSMSVKGWIVTSAYPNVDLRPDGDRTRMRWFLRVKKGGVVEDLLTGTEAHGLFVELLPDTGPRPAIGTNPAAPLVPAWPDVRPSNSWCLSQALFPVHVDRVLQTLGLPAQSRSTLITSWLPGITRHKNIAYRILNREQMEPSSQLHIIPPPQVIMRLMILYRGILDSELKEWSARTIGHDMGIDWRESVGFSPHLTDETLFRVIEYGAMEVFDPPA